MKCPHCMRNIPDDSIFCQVCGINIQEEKERIAEEERKKAELQKAKILEEEKQREAEEAAKNAPMAEIEVVKGEPKLPPKMLRYKRACLGLSIALIIAVLCLAGSIGMGVIQQKNIKEYQREKAKLEEKLQEKSDQVQQMRKTIDSLENQRRFASGNNHSDFYGNTDVLIIHVGETKSILVTRTDTGKVTYKAENTNVDLVWGKTNTHTMSLSVTGKEAGTTRITVRNSRTAFCFDILIIILP